MPILVMVVLFTVAIGIALLPPADVRPADEGTSSWISMSVATLAVLAVMAFAVHELARTDRVAHVDTATHLAGNP